MAESTLSPLPPQAKLVPPGAVAAKSLTPLSTAEYPAPPVMWAWVALVAVLAAVILAFTPYTNNLDDVKVTLLHVGGGGVLALLTPMSRSFTP